MQTSTVTRQVIELPNSSGVKGTGSGITPLINTGGDVVGYLAINPNAQYIVAGPGALATGRRNTLATQPTNDISLSTYKDFNIAERLQVPVRRAIRERYQLPAAHPRKQSWPGVGCE